MKDPATTTAGHPRTASAMPRPRAAPGRRRIALALLAWLLAGSGALHADRWYVHYDNAEKALASEDWRRAVEEINQALERRGDSGTRVRSYGMKVVDYFPYLKLGIAYYNLGQHDAALEAFATEERLGAVQDSAQAASELSRYKQLATAARDRTAEEAARRVERIVEQGLAEARELRRQGRLDEAMHALAPALAVSPEEPEAVELMADLRSEAVAAEQRRRDEQAAARMIEEAKTHLGRGEPQQAASLLRQALALRPDEEARRLLAQAQQAIAAAGDAARRRTRIEEALAAAETLGEDGRIDDALGRLEVVFALEPDHAAAGRLRDRLLAERRAAEQDSLLRETLAEAEDDLADGRFEEALAGANRALALERGQPQALDVVRRAYAAISRRLLAASSGEEIPPAIRFADLRQDLGGVLAERVRSPELRLSGVAIDSSPVTVELFDADDRPLDVHSSSQAVGEYHVTEFHADRRLEAGTSAFRVVATDAGGLSSASEYTVIYSRPWFRSPWVPVAAALVTGLGLAGLFAQRRGRRRRRLRRRFNPYVAGSPVFDEGLFYGREPLIQKILQTIHSNSLLLHGERRIGKTSLLHHLRRRLEILDDPDFRFYPVYIDLQGTPEEKLFATLADQVFDTLEPMGSESGRTAATGRDGYSHHDLLRELHGLLRRLAEGERKRVKLVLLIDEVDELNAYDPRVNQRLRSLFMKRLAEHLVAVVAGVQIRKEWEREASPWYNFFEEVEVQALVPEEARRLVLEPIRGVFRAAPGVAERIVAATGAKPYLIQRRCLALVDRLHAAGRRTITLADVEAVEREQAG